jgi:transcription elongation factor Elf1
MGTKLEVTSTTHILPFNELSPLDFERLCLWLVGREGYVRAEHLGAAGNEQGRDVIAYKPTPDGEELWYFQCKRYRSIGAATLKGEVDKYFQLEQETSQQKPVGVVFVTSCTISARTRKAVGAYCSEHGLAYEFWAKTELDEKVKRYRDIVDAFFRAGQGSKSVVGDGNVIGDHGQSHVAGVRIGNGFSGGTVAAAGHNVVVYTGDWSIPIDFYSNLARQLPQPRYPPIPSGELFAADLTPCFTCFQSASNSYPQKGEEIQVRLRITNESYVEAKDVQINIRLPSGYTRVDTCCDLSHYQAAVGPYH